MGLFKEREVFKSEEFQYVLEVDFQLQSFRHYLKLTDGVLKYEIKEKLKEYRESLEDNHASEIELHHNYEDHLIKIHTQHLFYNSLFISMYSFLEKKMYQLCKLAESKRDIKINDLSGDGIFKYYKYLKKVLLINTDEINDEWIEINKYNKLRNMLVHSAGNTIEYTKNNSKKIESIKSIKNISINEKVDYLEYGISDNQLLLDFMKNIGSCLRKIYFEKH